MSTESPLLKLTLQDLDENPDTWGTVLNVSGLETLEDAIAGTAAVDVTAAGDYTLDDTSGGPTQSDGARYMILDITGSPGAARNVIVPTRSKVYLAANSADDVVTVKTAAGAGAAIPVGEAYFVYCDGTDIVATTAGNASTATLATTATNATNLGGFAAAGYARLAVANTFTKGQVSTRVAVTLDTGNLDIDCSLSNSFYHLTTAALTLTAPTNATDGQQFSLIIEQGAGAPHTISFAASTFIWENGTVPALSTTFGDVDYLGFEYVTGLSGGARWVGSIIKGLA